MSCRAAAGNRFGKFSLPDFFDQNSVAPTLIFNS